MLKLTYQPPYNWPHLQAFLSARMIKGLEWSDKYSYGRTFTWNNKQGQCKGEFTATPNEEQHYFDINIVIDNEQFLEPVINNIRRILDLDANSHSIHKRLNAAGFKNTVKGLRLPGTWNVFEAGIRAILGQQISVAAARNLVKHSVNELGEQRIGDKVYFPSVTRIANSDFSFLKMPGRRKQTLIDLAKHCMKNSIADNSSNPDKWIDIKGIGPWTINYAKMRGLSDPDIYLGEDLGIKKTMQNGENAEAIGNPLSAAPYRSYLTFQLWNQLS